MREEVTVTTIPNGPPRWKPSAIGSRYVSDGGQFARVLGYVVELPSAWCAVVIVPSTSESPARGDGHLGNFPTEAEARAAVEKATAPERPPD